jgi:hypothetical protein
MMIERESQARLTRAIQDLQQYLGKSGPEALRLGANFFIRSGRARMPISKKKREVVKREHSPRHRAAWQIRRFTQRGYLPINSQKGPSDPRVKIARRGLARESWWWMRKSLGGAGGKKIPGIREQLVQEVKSNLKGQGSLFIELTHRLVYLNKIAPNVGAEALAAGARGIQHMIDRKMPQEMKRRWR